MTINKVELDMRTAAELSLPKRKVTQITTRFLEEIRRALVEDGEVLLLGLGTIYVLEISSEVETNLTKGTFKVGDSAGTITVKKPRHLRVIFKKGTALRTELRKGRAMSKPTEEMSKYAVSEGVNQEELEKRAAQGCPDCGAKPVRHGSTLLCPKCGSAPFEG